MRYGHPPDSPYARHFLSMPRGMAEGTPELFFSNRSGRMRIGYWKRAVLERTKEWGRQRNITGYVHYCAARPPRRALLSYLVLPFLLPSSDWVKTLFQNYGKATEIPRALNELGYAVDIVNYNNYNWLPSAPYDLFIGHGGINFERISRRLPENATRIYFASGIYWRELNDRVVRRAEDMTLRRGHSVSFLRTVDNDEDYALSHSNGIICLGNANATDTYSGFPQVIGINNAVDCEDWDGWRTKDYIEGRRHFLFFSGQGNVLKGLDLLLDVFAGMDLHLHICQHIEPDFSRIYRKELTEYPNIHVHGHIRVGSPKFRFLMKRCNWIIAPTCAEGQPGAVLVCMAYGMIPILSKAANITVGEWGLCLPDCKIETIKYFVLQASQTNADLCWNMARQVVEVVRSDYLMSGFRVNFKNAVEQLIASKYLKLTEI